MTAAVRARTLGEALRDDDARLAAGAIGARVTALTDRAVSVGVAQSEGSPLARRARALGWPVARRSTGGTGVLHLEGDIVWSLVLARADPRVGRDYVAAYGRLGEGVTATLDAAGVSAAWRPSRGLSEDCCFLGRRGWALEAGGRVIGGAAQHLSPTHLLHQGALAVRLDAEAASELFELPRATASEHLGCIGDRIGSDASARERFAERLAATLASWVAGASR